MVFRWVPVSIIQITTLWWQLWNWTACWMTPGRIGVIGLCRYMHKSHSACLCPLRVISLTHAIKDHLYGQITNLNPSPCLETPARPSRSKNHSSYFNRLTRSTICCNAESWRISSIPADMITPLSFRMSAQRRGDRRWSLTSSLWLPAFSSRIQRSVKHIRLLIFRNWISKKSLTPLILPISTAGLKHSLHCRWIKMRVIGRPRHKTHWMRWKNMERFCLCISQAT